MTVAAYVYTGWHPTPERDASFHPGFTEWELVAGCTPRFEGHQQPRRPALGTYDDRDPAQVEHRLALAVEHGVEAFVHGFFWCRGKRVFERALDEGYLACPTGKETPFALMWANRMPRRILPVRRADLPVIDETRRVESDEEDFERLIATVAEGYFRRDNYLRIEGRAYFSIYDSTFFLRELGAEGARRAIERARRWLAGHGFGELHLAAIEPNADALGIVREVGFDSVTHYVLLPDWKGPRTQDYRELSARRPRDWALFAERSGLPYFPAVSPGWDASPRGADFGPTRPDRYPWSPVVTGTHPAHFREALSRAMDWSRERHGSSAMVFIASLNEWSEGHYLEPDDLHGTGWLEAVRDAVRAQASTR